MDEETGKDFNLLSEENSDFDILLSPASGKSDDDDEVFLGPVRHVEKCIAIGIDLNYKEEESFKSTETVSWSPLNTDQFVEVSREANLLAQHFGSQVEGKSKKMGNKMIHNKVVEQFIEESKLKLALLKGISSPSCPRRETFIVQDSPLRFLPPAIQKSLQVCSSNTHCGFPLQSPKKAAAGIINSSVPPLQNCRNPSFGNNDVACTENTTLREVPPGEQLTCASTKVTSEKPKPGTGLTPSRKKHLNNTSSSDDQSDAAGIISDVIQPKVSGSKASSSVKKHSASMAVRTLNHTSSTSSVHSSLHNSASGSRAVSVNIPVNSSKLQTSKNGSRVSAPKSKSSSTCAIDVPKTKLMKPTNTCKLTTSGTVNQQGSVMQTLPSKGLQIIGSIDMKVDTKIRPNKVANVLGRDQCPKAKTSIFASQTSKRSSAPSPRTTRPKVTEPKKLLSCSAIESGIETCAPNKPPTRGMLQTPNAQNRPASVTPGTRRLSALPTPLSRRRSGIPTFTPRTQPRPGLSSHQATANQNHSMSASGTIRASEQKMLRKLQVLCTSSSSEEEISPPLVPCFLDFSPDKPQTVCQEKAVEHSSETPVKENLFIEVSTKIKQTEDRPLIDLSNTPDLKRVASMKAPESLIDFSSPLIKLSPANKENVDVDSPLLKF
ncbi:G2 and S phase-expressed protein 1 isoform X2 [Scyliorhinus canicula]|nr:G2 and S phase-expressed protein 1 isoform X2 [Scyliorhinus canicula]XP_038667301.1 G2 and S phase-expressed protein 1 isoform X2 [Scyliorhinus canicula]